MTRGLLSPALSSRRGEGDRTFASVRVAAASGSLDQFFSTSRWLAESRATVWKDQCPVWLKEGNGISKAERAVTRPMVLVQPCGSVMENWTFNNPPAGFFTSKPPCSEFSEAAGSIV